ncbi:VanZ family protein, partial [Gemmatimonadota bacterium]
MQVLSQAQLRQNLPKGALVLSLAAIAVLTLAPSESAGGGGWACVFCSTFALADAILNVLLFVPLGFSLRLLRLRAVHAILIGVCVALTVESLQLFIVPGGDLFTNSLGCGLGYVVAATAHWWLSPPPQRAVMMSLLSAFAVIFTVAATGILLRPSFPNTKFYGQWTPRLGHLEWYRGSVVDARIGPLLLAPGLLENQDSLLALWLAGIPLDVQAIAGPRPRALASLFSIYDDQQQEILLLGPDRDDLVLRYRTLAITLGLHQPTLR